MRIVLAFLLMMCGFTAAHAQVKVDGADVVERGLYKIEKVEAIKDAAISAGQRTEAEEVKLVESAWRIQAKKDIVIGLKVKLSGRPHGRIVPLRVVWRYPEPGLRNPNTGTTMFRDEYVDSKSRIGGTRIFYWSMSEEWTLVPGTWTFELWHNDRLLVKQDFALSKG